MLLQDLGINSHEYGHSMIGQTLHICVCMCIYSLVLDIQISANVFVIVCIYRRWSVQWVMRCRHLNKLWFPHSLPWIVVLDACWYDDDWLTWWLTHWNGNDVLRVWMAVGWIRRKTIDVRMALDGWKVFLLFSLLFLRFRKDVHFRFGELQLNKDI